MGPCQSFSGWTEHFLMGLAITREKETLHPQSSQAVWKEQA